MYFVEEPTRSLTDKAKGNKQKVNIPKPTIMKKAPRISHLKKKEDSPSKTTLVKKDTPHKALASKRKRVERIELKTTEKVTQTRKIMSSSDSGTSVEDDVLEIITTYRRKIYGKKVILNVPDAPLDNVSFDFVANV